MTVLDPGAKLDKAAMEVLLQRCCGDHTFGEIHKLDLVDAKPGRRATYEVQTENRSRPLFIKWYAEARQAGLAAETIEMLSAVLPPVRANSVVELLGSDEHTIVVEGAAGTRLDTTDRSPEDRGRLAARWLSLLHLAPVELSRTLDQGGERETLVRWLSSIPDVVDGPTAEQITARFANFRSEPAAPLVPIHKDFHHGHVYVDPTGAVAVIDFDEARMGPADFDIAHFVVNLEVLGARLQLSWPALIAQHFMTEYSKVTGWQQGPDFEHWRMYCLVKVLWQSDLGVGAPGISPAPPDVSEWLKAVIAS